MVAALPLLPICFPLWPLPPLPQDRWAHLPTLSHLQRFPSERAARLEVAAIECRIDWLKDYRRICPWRQRQIADDTIAALTERQATWTALSEAWNANAQIRMWWTSDNELARRTMLDVLRRRLGHDWQFATMP